MARGKKLKTPKKPRTSPPSPESESPVVSDDDGFDVGYDESTKSVIPDENVEVLPDEFTEGEKLNDISQGEESDSSSDGDINPVGDIPMRWYDGYDHIGYDRSGEQIIRKNKPSALDLAADPSSWRRIYDEKNDEEIILTHDELKEIARMRAGRYPAFDPDDEGEAIHWSGAPLQHPLSNRPEPKRRFLPSRHEAKLVVKLVRGMRAGVIRKPSEIAKSAGERETLYQYDIWEAHQPKTREEMTKSERARDIMRVPAPKPALPTHGESYNPPAEYLPSKEEAEEWKNLDPEDRTTTYLPQKFNSLRHVPNFDNFIKERFERCLDLYLAVRVFKDQKRVDPEEYLPKLPSARDLRPFPTEVVTSFGPLPSRARSIDVHPSGQWLLSGSDDGFVRLWETSNGHLQASWHLGSLVNTIDKAIPPISAVAWSPRENSQVFAASIGRTLIIIGAAAAMGISTEETDIALEASKDKPLDPKVKVTMQDAGIVWHEKNFDPQEYGHDDDNVVGNGSAKRATGMRDQENNLNSTENMADESGADLEASDQGPENHSASGALKELSDEEYHVVLKDCPAILITHSRPLRTFCWHRKGDYLACVGKDSTGGIVAIHRLSHRSSQMPFKKKVALVQAVKFHPTRPFFLVATMHHVRIYNLSLQKMVKNLKPGVSWISSIDVHPSGDHVLVTSYDRRLCWFDLDLSVRPYKTIRNHEKAIRVAKFHPRLPLFADGSDDGSSHVFHGTVYDDLNKNALIVPLRRLNGCSKVTNSVGVLDVAWHPRLPWLFTSGGDNTIHLLTDCSQG